MTGFDATPEDINWPTASVLSNGRWVDDRSLRSPVRDYNRPYETWPAVLGYNRVTADEESDVWATVDEDPLLAIGSYGSGRTFAFTTDCVPHWAPLAFLEWDGLPKLWEAILEGVTGDPLYS